MPFQPAAPSRVTSAWHAAFPGVPITPSALRGALPERWVRFHYLPGSRRIALDDQDRAEILRRYATVLGALAGQPQVVVITAGWPQAPGAPASRPEIVGQLMPAAELPVSAPEPGDELAITLYASAGAVSDPAFAQLLLVVAADEAPETLVMAPDASWLFHPYDGGMDVIARNAADRERMAREFAEWRSPRADGL